MNRLHLVDVSSLARSKWFFLQDLSYEVEGKLQGTGGLYSVLSIFNSISLHHKVIFCFDLGRSNRKDENSDYKRGRQKIDPELGRQLKLLGEILYNCGFDVMGEEGYEADDFIVGSHHHLKDRFDSIYIHSNDNDMAQLIDQKTLLIPAIQKRKNITIHNYKEQLKIPYNTKLLHKATVGDGADKIKGIVRFGEKSFEKFIHQVSEQYDLANIRQLDQEEEIIKNWDFTETQKAQALESLSLAKSRVPDKYKFKGNIGASLDVEMFKWYLKRYGMTSILRKLH